MAVIRDTLVEIAEMDYVSQVLVVGRDGSWLEGIPPEEKHDLGASFFYALGTLTRLGEVAEVGGPKHMLMEMKEGVLFLAALGTEAVLGIVAKPEVNRGLLLSRLASWAEQLRGALG